MFQSQNISERLVLFSIFQSNTESWFRCYCVCFQDRHHQQLPDSQKCGRQHFKCNFKRGQKINDSTIQKWFCPNASNNKWINVLVKKNLGVKCTLKLVDSMFHHLQPKIRGLTRQEESGDERIDLQSSTKFLCQIKLHKTGAS